jgi:DNA-directed RNA polymerase subunit beta
MLTIKSDDVVGRAKAFEAIVKGTDIPTPKVPESFKVLIKELQSLGLNVVPMGAVAYNEMAEEKEEQASEAVKAEVQQLEQSLEVENVADTEMKEEPSESALEEAETGAAAEVEPETEVAQNEQ